MGLAWQQGPLAPGALAPGAIGHFLVHDPLPGRLLFAEPLRRYAVRVGTHSTSRAAWQHTELPGYASDVDASALTKAKGQTFCPYKGLCGYYDIADARKAAWSDKVEVHLDGTRPRLESGQTMIPHGIDRNLDLDEAPSRQT